jgi:16S rRNA (guanine527-N7)-methyltransferase
VQVIDFIDKNDNTLVDLGSGAGFPGIVLAITLKDRKIPLKIKLIEKSPKKVKFLRDLINKLQLDVDVINRNVLEDSKKLLDDVFVARAFKPLKIILQLIHNKAENWKKVFIFLGKTGKSELLQASKSWEIEYKQRVSITSDDSTVIEINRLKKK